MPRVYAEASLKYRRTERFRLFINAHNLTNVNGG